MHEKLRQYWELGHVPDEDIRESAKTVGSFISLFFGTRLTSSSSQQRPVPDEEGSEGEPVEEEQPSKKKSKVSRSCGGYLASRTAIT
jgi:hypothetical protein